MVGNSNGGRKEMMPTLGRAAGFARQSRSRDTQTEAKLKRFLQQFSPFHQRTIVDFRFLPNRADRTRQETDKLMSAGTIITLKWNTLVDC